MASKSNFTNMVVVLTSICLVCAAILGFVYSVTAEPIRQAEVAKINNAIASVVPEFNNNPSEEVFEVDGAQVYPAKMDTTVVGYAVKIKTSSFGGPMQMMVGFDNAGNIYNTSVISHADTPGLGAKMTDNNIKLRTELVGINPASVNLSVKKDGGDIDAITAATITSRSFLKGVDLAYQVFLKVQSQN
ncbi:MAG: RnfABCDGE type electron transport complex subunit G [Bacteroidales bacterium]|jgi:Na+-translocating ferredoxin:NAD+ oxidoreductase subunit G|nr:RnfABCDGE type electron transport complex subunit G [Bacteroidales bacterium]MDD3200374.1 RnfABCDGE type electron transport complex subunit G [Bacteroidales bacterium]